MGEHGWALLRESGDMNGFATGLYRSVKPAEARRDERENESDEDRGKARGLSVRGLPPGVGDAPCDGAGDGVQRFEAQQAGAVLAVPDVRAQKSNLAGAGCDPAGAGGAGDDAHAKLLEGGL